MMESVKMGILINESKVSLGERNVPKFVYYNTKKYLNALLKPFNTFYYKKYFLSVI